MLKLQSKYLLVILLLQVFGFAFLLWFLFTQGYLPSPFLSDKADTFMDLFHPLYWAQDAGRYTEWKSIYPPLNFLLLRAGNVLNLGEAVSHNAFELREASLPVIYAWFFSYLLIPALMVRSASWQVFSSNERVLLYLIIILCVPMLFTLERGNLILLCLLVLPFYLGNTGWRRNLCLALLINLKPYFALLLLIPLIRRNWRLFLKQVAWAGVLFLVSGILLIDPTFLNFFCNLFSFASETVQSLRDILSMPSSISFISSIFKDFQSKYTDFFALRALTQLMVFIVEFVKWGIIAWAILAAAQNQKHFTDQQITALMLVIITNIGVWVGGYSLIFYSALIPVLLCMSNPRLYACLLFGMILTLDVIPLAVHSVGYKYSYITNTIVDVNWYLTLSGVARPFLNLILLAALAKEFWRTGPSPLPKTAD